MSINLDKSQYADESAPLALLYHSRIQAFQQYYAEHVLFA